MKLADLAPSGNPAARGRRAGRVMVAAALIGGLAATSHAQAPLSAAAAGRRRSLEAAAHARQAGATRVPRHGCSRTSRVSRARRRACGACSAAPTSSCTITSMRSALTGRPWRSSRIHRRPSMALARRTPERRTGRKPGTGSGVPRPRTASTCRRSPKIPTSRQSTTTRALPRCCPALRSSSIRSWSRSRSSTSGAAKPPTTSLAGLPEISVTWMGMASTTS